MTDELATLREQNVRLRSKLLSLAAECPECDGTGCITEIYDVRRVPRERVVPCDECADIRAVLSA